MTKITCYYFNIINGLKCYFDFMVKNRDAKKGFKLSEKQKKIAGKFPFHRVHKLNKLLNKIIIKK